MGIDLSKAFDCIDRGMLMQTLDEQGVASEDELRIDCSLPRHGKEEQGRGQRRGFLLAVR